MKRSIGAKTVIFPTPVFVVGTYDDDGKPNIMTVAWGGICASNPPSIAISVRKSRHTYKAIAANQAFTLSLPSVDQAKEADYAGIESGANVDKFAELELTPVKGSTVNAPYVGEFPLAVECALIHSFDLGSHVQFVGEIMDVKADEDVFDANGVVDITKVRPLTFSPSDGGYYGIGEYIGQSFSIGKRKPEDGA